MIKKLFCLIVMFLFLGNLVYAEGSIVEEGTVEEVQDVEDSVGEIEEEEDGVIVEEPTEEDEDEIVVIVEEEEESEEPTEEDEDEEVIDDEPDEEAIPVQFMDLFKMSMCPFAQELEKTLYELVEDFDGSFVVSPNFIITEGSGDTCFNGYCSIHGEHELTLDIVEYCVYHELGQEDYFEFVTDLDESCYELADSELLLGECLDEADIVMEDIEECLNNDENILEWNAYLTEDFSVIGSPTMFFWQEKYTGSRDYGSLKNVICEKIDYNAEICQSEIVCEIDEDCPTINHEYCDGSNACEETTYYECESGECVVVGGGGGCRPCEHECYNGNCVAEPYPMCTDSDDGIDIFEKGIVDAYNFPEPQEDSCCINCMTAPTLGGPWISEYYCDGFEGEREIERCKWGCEDGECIDEPRPIVAYDDVITCEDNGERLVFDTASHGNHDMTKYSCIDESYKVEYNCGDEEIVMEIVRCDYGCSAFNGMCRVDEDMIVRERELYEGWNLLPIGKGVEFRFDDDLEDYLEAAYVYDSYNEEYVDLFEDEDVLGEIIDERGYAAVWVYISDDMEMELHIDLEEIQETVEELDFEFPEGWNFYVILPHMYRHYSGGYLNIGEDDGEIYIKEDRLFAWENDEKEWEDGQYTEIIEEEIDEDIIGIPFIMNHVEEFEVTLNPGLVIPDFPEI